MGVRIRVRRVREFARVTFACVVLLAQLILAAHAKTLVVLYPDVPQPERDVFALLRDGIHAEATRDNVEVVSMSLSENPSSTEYAERIRGYAPRSVIALGRRSYQLTRTIDLDVPVIVGGVDLPVGPGVSGVSMTPDPQVVLATLRSVAPQMRRVIVVTNAERDRWILEPARRAAEAKGLQLQVHTASSVGEAAAHYLNVFRYSNPRTDAIWILDDDFVTSDTLPRIVEESWARNFLVFSNVMAHVRQGVLFAHYPDPRPLGERLARIALMPRRRADVLFLTDVKRAANVRMGAHLAPNISNAQLAQFDILLGRE